MVAKHMLPMGRRRAGPKGQGRRPIQWSIALFLALLVALVAAGPVYADSTVVVRPGDNLYRIALRYGTTVRALVQANGLPSPDVIYAGQRLRLPGGGSTPATAQPKAGVHVVRPGENLFRIALRYGTTVSTLTRANGLRSADVIYAGQRLIIPFGTAPAAVAAPAVGGTSGRRILIDLSAQRLTALENGQAVASFVVSTGKASTPTPVGTFRIYLRYRWQRMVGPGYDLPNVPYVQYFIGSYALHGTYWHTAFGVPVSHGCVNMRTADAAWLWSWAGIGTPVTVEW